MKVSFKAERAIDIPMTMTITMALGNWRIIASALAGGDRSGVAQDFRHEINRMIEKAEADFGN